MTLSDERRRQQPEVARTRRALVAGDDQILGFSGFGYGAGELLSAIQLAMNAKLPYAALSSLIIAHPTLAEALVNLFSAVPGRA
jgi:pyruvate/2-oxoglutarate dehydrogenase complex dihydrolipoamide dehydrogenase (E3) component